MVRRMIGAAEALARLERGELSAEELVRDCLARIEEREPVVQAWEALDVDGALREARRIDRMRDKPPLGGLPLGVKDLIDTKDLPTAYGSPIHRGHRPAADAGCVRLLREAGAIVLGKTVTTEFAVYSPGKTRNPHDPARTPGGSSSGSAAAVADGMVPFALGSQTAASVVRPASFCGVIGFKPTHGLVPLDGVHPLAPSLDTLGFFVRRLEDAAPLLEVLVGRPALKMDTGRPRLGFVRTEAWPRAAPETQRAVEDAARRLEAREIELGAAFTGLVDAQIAIMGAEASQALREEPRERLSPMLRQFLQDGAAVPPERLSAAREQAERCRHEMDTVFRRIDALVTPAAVGEAPVGLETTGDPLFSRIWTLLGTPCLSLPVLRGPAGLPIGLQVVGPRGDEGRLLGAASWIVKELGA
jgi:Asp-tRNA(Asn)/Glu-tRNA(Gln) amidotransferase A subunit family amidase